MADQCGCDGGLTRRTPVAIFNPPGLTSIVYRVGTHARFKQTLLAELSAGPLLAGAEREQYRILESLATRDDRDFSIAYLDAVATVAEVLSFYVERNAQEHFLRTSTERFSIVELARAIGYEPRPGLAAATLLAFTMDALPGAPTRAILDVGTKVQSLPGPGEQAQIYETVEAIEARLSWSAIRPRVSRRHPLPYNPTNGTSQLVFEGVGTQIRPGDAILYFEDRRSRAPAFGLASEVVPRPEVQQTWVTLQLLPTPTMHTTAPAPAPPPPASPAFARLIGTTQTAASLDATAEAGRFEVEDLFASLLASRQSPPTALVFRTRAAVFGHNAPPFETLPEDLRKQLSTRLSHFPFLIDPTPGGSPGPGPHVNPIGGISISGPIVSLTGNLWDTEPYWADATLDGYRDEGANDRNVYLDASYPGVTRGSLAVLRDGDTIGVYRVDDATDVSKALYTLTGKSTRLRLSSRDGFKDFNIRRATVFAQPDALPLARVPVDDLFPPHSTTRIMLEGWVAGLAPGQRVVVAGPLTDPRGTSGAEAATIEAVAHLLRPEGGTVIELKQPLGQGYVRAGVTINANVARATHGDTRAEILGSGDATQVYQRFTLRQTPLTYVGASTPSGVESTLRVYVDDVLWQEVPSLYGHGPDEHIYVTRHHDDGTTTIQFGGRLPTGQDNVRAIYRRGIGLEGLVKRDQLSLLMSRPLGLGGVTNPLPSTGADDPETLEAARRNAPLTVLTLDRIVSLRDYEDFARAFAGVSKALATWIQVGEDRGVLVTVAGPNGAAIQDVGSDSVYRHLLDAMRQAGDPSVPVRLVSYRPRTFHLGAVVKVDRTRLVEKVVPAVAAALGDAFSFAARSLGQAVTLSEVIGIIQSVNGVVAVAVDALHRTDESPGPAPAQVLLAARPTPGAGASAQPAELLTLESAPPDLRGTQGELP